MPVDPAIPSHPNAQLRQAERLSALERKVNELERQLQGSVVGGVPLVAALPTAGRAGRLVMLSSDKRIYRDNGSAWVVGA